MVLQQVLLLVLLMLRLLAHLHACLWVLAKRPQVHQALHLVRAASSALLFVLGLGGGSPG